MSFEAQTSKPGPAFFRWPWYPFVAAIFPLWFIYANNLEQVSASSVVAGTAAMLGVVGLVFLIAARVTGSSHVGALITLVGVVGFYVYGPIHVTAVRLTTDPPFSPWFSAIPEPFTNHQVLTPVMLVLCAMLAFVAARRLGSKAERFTGPGNVTALALAVILLTRIGTTVWQQRELQVSPALADVGGGRQVSVLGYNPDIYYIIVDGYARADVLQKYYDFDNSEFLAALGKRGFALNDHSRANYYWTFLSLA